jgi:hypothetical protein
MTLFPQNNSATIAKIKAECLVVSDMLLNTPFYTCVCDVLKIFLLQY